MGLYDEHHEFSPILIPISTRMDELRVTYHIYMQSGDVHEVKANSAAEAVEQLGLTGGILRISNAAHETRMMLDSNLLNPNGMAVATDITMTEKTKNILVVDEQVTQQLKDEFTTFTLVDYANATSRKNGEAPVNTSPAPTPNQPKAPPTPSAQTHAIAQEYQDYLKEDVDYIEIAPPEELISPETSKPKDNVNDEFYSVGDNLEKLFSDTHAKAEIQSENELSPEQVRNLLTNKDI
jgi:hypothetical protein